MDQIPAPNKTLGAALIGVILASVLYGVSCVQAFYYFSNYSKKDTLPYKAAVFATWLSDSIHQALICHTIYSYLIKGYFKPQMLEKLVWSLLVEVIFNGITALLVQCFFAARIWKFSREKWYRGYLAGTIVLFILAEFAVVIVYAEKSLYMTTFAQLATLKTLSMTVNALAVVADVLITAASCYLLHEARTRNKLPNLNTAFNLLIAFSLQTGMLTSLCAIASLISISVSPNTFVYIGFYFILGRLYCNSLLATLNIRKTIRSRGNSIPGIPLSPIEENYNQPRPVGPRLPDKTEQKKSWVTRPTSSDCPSAGQHLSPVSESLEMGRGLDLEGQNEGDLKSSSL